jgi:hypothetical protein
MILGKLQKSNFSLSYKITLYNNIIYTNNQIAPKYKITINT